MKKAPLSPQAFARAVLAELGSEAARLEIRPYSVGVALGWLGAAPGVVLTGVPGLRGFATMRAVAVDGPFGMPRPLGAQGGPAAIAAALRTHPEWLGAAPVLSLHDALLAAARAEGGFVTTIDGITPQVTTLFGETRDWLGLADLASPADPFAVRHRGGRFRLLGPAREVLAADPRGVRLLARIGPIAPAPVDPGLVRVECGDGLPAFLSPGTWDPADVSGLDDPTPSEVVGLANALIASGRPGSALVALRAVRGWVEHPPWDRVVEQVLTLLRARR